MPDGIYVPDNSTLNIRAKFRMDKQRNSEVVKLVRGLRAFGWRTLWQFVGMFTYMWVTTIHKHENI